MEKGEEKTMKDEQFNQMPQLDRIEYLQNFLFQKIRLMFIFLLGTLSFAVGFILALFGIEPIVSTTLIIIGSLFCWGMPLFVQLQFKKHVEARFLKKNNLDEKPKEVVK